MENVNILERVYERLGKEYPGDEDEEDEKDLAKILRGTTNYDITNVSIDKDNIKDNIKYLLDEHMTERSNFCNKHNLMLGITPTAKEILDKLKEKYPEKEKEDFIKEEIKISEFGGGGKSKKRKSKKHKSKKHKYKKRKRNKRKTRRKKR